MMKKFIPALALSALFAGHAQAKTIDITAQFGEQRVTAEIDCDRLGDIRRPGLQTLTQLDSMIHGYEGDVYLDLEARERELDKVLESYDESRRAIISQAFNRQYAEFDQATIDGQRMSVLARKLALHRIDVGQVLQECAAP